MGAGAASRRIIVVTKNFVAAEDLKEILGSFVDSTVDSHSSVKEMRSDGYDLAIIGAAVETLLGDGRIHEMRRRGTKFTVLRNVSPDSDGTWAGMALLSQPVRSGDVAAALERLGVR